MHDAEEYENLLIPEDEYEKRRTEFNRQSFRKILFERYGDKCVNCGATPIEYHHIVPLRIGGTNSVENIVPLCTRCHDLVHYTKMVRRSAYIRNLCTGRPKRKLPDNFEQIMDDYIFGRIGRKEAQQMIYGDVTTKLNDRGLLARCLAERKIIHFYNYIDINRCKGRKPQGDKSRVEILFSNGDHYIMKEDGTEERENICGTRQWRYLGGGDADA